MPYLTPETVPSEVVCRRLRIPNDLTILGAVTGALAELTKPHKWEQDGTVTPDEIAAAMTRMLSEFSGADACMIGMIFPFIRNALPDNWLLCDGTVYERVDYPELYAAWVGFGLVLDADTFATPDLGGRFLLPANVAWPVFSLGGESAHILTISEMPSHDHVVPTNGAGVVASGAGAPVNVRITTGNVTTNTRGGGNAHNNMPPYVSLPFAVIAR